MLQSTSTRKTLPSAYWSLRISTASVRPGFSYSCHGSDLRYTDVSSSSVSFSVELWRQLALRLRRECQRRIRSLLDRHRTHLTVHQFELHKDSHGRSFHREAVC